MDSEPNLQKYLEHQKKLETLRSIWLLLEWDQDVNLPAGAGDDRAEQSALISGLLHEQVIDETYMQLVTTLSIDRNSLDSDYQRSIAVATREIDKETKLSKEFVEEFAKAKSAAWCVWVEAKKENDFNLFAPHLEKVFAMARSYAAQVAPEKEPYDVRLDEYEEGMNQEFYDKLLLPLQEPITTLIQKQPGWEKDLAYTINDYDHVVCKKMLEELVATVGFDLNRGMIGEAHHPFANLISPNDERINTAYHDLIDCTYSLIHEMWHGLYDQNGRNDLHRTNVAYNMSLGMHESQSRLIENIIGKSEGFLTYLLTLFQKYFPEQTKEFTVEGLHDYLTKVNPSYIRIQADEVTYNMHVLLRYQIEKWLMNGSIAVKDLPQTRDNLMQTYLWITPSNDAQGCLQDVHWSCWLIGYFPTYMLGNIIWAQLFNTFKITHPDREKEIAVGNFNSYKNRFLENVRQHGRLYPVLDHVKRITWEDLDSTYFLDYLKKKYS